MAKAAAHAASAARPASTCRRRRTRSMACRQSWSRGRDTGATRSRSTTSRERYGLDRAAAQAKAVDICGRVAARHARPDPVAGRAAGRAKLSGASSAAITSPAGASPARPATRMC